MDKEIAGEILQALYWCRALGIRKSKWRYRIAEKLRNSGILHSGTTDAFCETWSELDKLRLI